LTEIEPIKLGPDRLRRGPRPRRHRPSRSARDCDPFHDRGGAEQQI